MNNGENGGDSRHHPSRRRSVCSIQPYGSESSGSESGETPAPDPHSEALFAAFLNAHGGDTLEDIPSGSLSCFGPARRCCKPVFGKLCCMFTCILSSIGGLGGAGVGCCIELLSRSVSNISPTAITSATTTGFSVPAGTVTYGLAGCIICGSLGCICSYCTRPRNTLERIEDRMIRLRIVSAIRSSIREEQGPYVTFNARSQSVTTQPRAVGFSDSTDNPVVTSQPSRGSMLDVGGGYIPGEHQRVEEGNSSEGSDEGSGDEHIYETVGGIGGAVGGDEEPIYEEIGFYTASLIPGYSYEGQVSSLLGMQCVLTDVSIQVPQKLRRLALKAYEKIPEMYPSLQDNKASSPSVANYGQVLKVTKNPAKQNQNHIPYHVFAFKDDYEANLECKVRSSQAGVIAELCTGVHIGLTYSRHNDEKKEYTGMLDAGRGSVKARPEIESIAAVVTFNADRPGITGHFAGCYGWGTVRNKRFFTHAGRETSSSGSPAISITGGLVQIGYNLYVSKSYSVTPYIEGVLSIATCEPYNEKRGVLPCKLSESNESIFEKSIGLRSNWRFSEDTVLQMWISGVSGTQTSSNVSLQPLVAPMKRYEVSVPMKNENYLRTECGATYLLKITDSLSTGATMLCSFAKERKLYNQQLTACIQYVY